MSPGYNRPLYLPPFDHRHSYISGMCHLTPPLTAAPYSLPLVLHLGYESAGSHPQVTPPGRRESGCRS